MAVKTHNLPLLYIGNGVIGGIGLGCGYIAPVSTLLKWFPDRRGLATGLAIMGFGGGAIIGAPLSVLLMQKYQVWQTFIILGTIYFVAMMVGAFSFRVPPPGWKPEGWSSSASQQRQQQVSSVSDTTASSFTDEEGVEERSVIVHTYVDANRAIRTPQFWLLWIILCMNVSCGIALLSQASPMIQDIFQGTITPTTAGAIVGLWSLFNIFGRIFWSSLSDKLGRWTLYSLFFVVGIILYACVPSAGHAHNFPGFFVCTSIIVSMYGGGFAAIPAYISDFFGLKHAGAIHGRILTAWSVAAVLGPYMLSSIRQEMIEADKPKANAYDKTMYILCGLLAIGLVANLALPLVERYLPTERQVEEKEGKEEEVKEKEVAQAMVVDSDDDDAVAAKKEGMSSNGKQASSSTLPVYVTVALMAIFWSVPSVGLAWGLYQNFEKIIHAF